MAWNFCINAGVFELSYKIKNINLLLSKFVEQNEQPVNWYGATSRVDQWWIPKISKDSRQRGHFCFWQNWIGKIHPYQFPDGFWVCKRKEKINPNQQPHHLSSRNRSRRYLMYIDSRCLLPRNRQRKGNLFHRYCRSGRHPWTYWRFVYQNCPSNRYHVPHIH